MTPEEIALERYQKIRPFLQEQATLEEITKLTNTARRTLYNWVKAFKRDGLNGLTPRSRKDKGQRRSANEDLIKLIKGLYLKTPTAPVSAIHRIVQEVCTRNGWRVPSYDVVHDIASNIAPALKTLAHDGDKAYKQAYDLIHRREAEQPNEIWQADHTPLDIVVLDLSGKAVKPWLTAILDDYSRAVPGYYLGFDPPSSMRIATALRQGIWRKKEPGWSVCGIPDKLYSDRGSDFTSKHLDQISIDLKFELVQTLPAQPQGKGKVERFFNTINQMFLSSLPGYSPRRSGQVEPVLTLEELDQKFRSWLIDQYLQREHSETGMTPSSRWESFPFLPRMPDSLEQLDVLLLTVAKPRRVQRDGIRFQGFRYFDVNLSGYVGEYVTIRYDPRDLAEIYVYADDALVCRAVCFELSDKTVGLKDIIKARNHRKKQLNQDLRELLIVADKHVRSKSIVAEPAVPDYPKFKIKRFACDD